MRGKKVEQPPDPGLADLGHLMMAKSILQTSPEGT